METVYLVSNFDPEKLNFIGVFAMLLFCASLFYDIYATYLYMKDEHKRSKIFKFFSKWTFRSALMILIMWSTFMLINQINGWLDIFRLLDELI